MSKKKSASLPDIKPTTPIRVLDRTKFGDSSQFDVELVAPVVGMSPTFVRKVIGSGNVVSSNQLLELLDQDAFGETFVPRSGVLKYLNRSTKQSAKLSVKEPIQLLQGNATSLLQTLEDDSVKCVVTSPPYWGTRIYERAHSVDWADGENCPYGHEQTPEAYIRHTVEVLSQLKRVITPDGSIWWNVMDTFNTRTQIRGNAVEALRAMQGKDKTSWGEYQCRRYSAGHAFLKDGEQCSIPARICERASRIGLYVKSIVTWVKNSSLPEPQNSRVSRNLEYVIHFSKHRTPYFNKEAYRTTLPALGGRGRNESDKLTDTWVLSTAVGQNGHGAQFALALPGRCISLTARKGDLVLDPFVGGGTSGAAARQLGCRFVGFDVSDDYLEIARKLLAGVRKTPTQRDPQVEQRSLAL